MSFKIVYYSIVDTLSFIVCKRYLRRHFHLFLFENISGINFLCVRKVIKK